MSVNPQKTKCFKGRNTSNVNPHKGTKGETSMETAKIQELDANRVNDLQEGGKGEFDSQNSLSLSLYGGHFFHTCLWLGF